MKKLIKFVPAGALIKITPQMRKYILPPTEREKSLLKLIHELEEEEND